jgi:hypothetical protein
MHSIHDPASARPASGMKVLNQMAVQHSLPNSSLFFKDLETLELLTT